VRAATVVTPGTIEISTVPDPAPGPAEVVVRPAAVGICGTDLHIMDGGFAPSFPIVPGHEFAGEIVAVGSAVTGHAVGDQVAVDPSLHCGHCYHCKRARGNQCENWGAIGVTVAGAATVSVVDLNPERLKTAELLGCTAAVTGADELDAPHGWDVVIDCTGAEAAIRDGLRRVGRGGTFLQFGVSNEGTTVPIEPYEIYRREITVTGSMAVLHSFDRAGELMAAGVLDPQVFVSHRFPLDRYAEALQQFRAGIGRKILIEP
jgi:threonine dehydrogenase-like Zn-dependent dehydrogenase